MSLVLWIGKLSINFILDKIYFRYALKDTKVIIYFMMNYDFKN